MLYSSHQQALTSHNTHSEEDHSSRDHFQHGGPRLLCFCSWSAKVVLPLLQLVKFTGASLFGLGSPAEDPVYHMLVSVPKWSPCHCSCLLSQSLLSIQQPGKMFTKLVTTVQNFPVAFHFMKDKIQTHSPVLQALPNLASAQPSDLIFCYSDSLVLTETQMNILPQSPCTYLSL